MGASFSSSTEHEEGPGQQLPPIRESSQEEELEAMGSRDLDVPVIRHEEQRYHEEQDRTYLGEEFVKCKPQTKLTGQENPQFTHDKLRLAPPLALKAFNHVGLGVSNVDAVRRFYTKVLGFQEIPRPNLMFEGHWLYGLGFMIHIIEKDPSVPLKIRNWEELYNEVPEAWYNRRGRHLAFEVENFDAAERTLRMHGVEYSRFVLPGTNEHQLFFYDPEGNGIEIGVYGNIRAFLKSKNCHVDV